MINFYYLFDHSIATARFQLLHLTSSLYFTELDEVEHAHGAITSVSKKKYNIFIEVEVDEIIVAYYFVSITHTTSLYIDMVHSNNLYPIAHYIYNQLNENK
jgi:hypothetical protein